MVLVGREAALRDVGSFDCPAVAEKSTAAVMSKFFIAREAEDDSAKTRGADLGMMECSHSIVLAAMTRRHGATLLVDNVRKCRYLLPHNGTYVLFKAQIVVSPPSNSTPLRCGSPDSPPSQSLSRYGESRYNNVSQLEMKKGFRHCFETAMKNYITVSLPFSETYSTTVSD